MSIITRILIIFIKGYRCLVSPCLPASCRFIPTCSCYALEALSYHGAWRGSGLIIRRLLRCHPFEPGGLDPVPPPKSARSGFHLSR